MRFESNLESVYLVNSTKLVFPFSAFEAYNRLDVMVNSTKLFFLFSAFETGNEWTNRLDDTATNFCQITYVNRNDQYGCVVTPQNEGTSA